MALWRAYYTTSLDFWNFRTLHGSRVDRGKVRPLRWIAPCIAACTCPVNGWVIMVIPFAWMHYAAGLQDASSGPMRWLVHIHTAALSKKIRP